MKKQLLNYETLLKVAKAISHSREPEEVYIYIRVNIWLTPNTRCSSFRGQKEGKKGVNT